MVSWDADERWQAKRDRIDLAGGPAYQPPPIRGGTPRPPDPDDYDELSHAIHRRLEEIGMSHPAYADGRKLMFHILEAHARGEDWLDEIGHPADDRPEPDWLDWDDPNREKL